MFLNVPKQDIPNYTWQKLVDIVCGLTLAGLFAYIWYQMDQIPGLVPTRFDISGNVSVWQPKSMLYVTPGIGVFVFMILAFVRLDPRFVNIPVKVNEKNALPVIAAASRWVSVLQVLITLKFVWIVLESVRVAKNSGQGATLFPVYVAVAILLVTVIAMTLNIRKIAVKQSPGVDPSFKA